MRPTRATATVPYVPKHKKAADAVSDDVTKLKLALWYIGKCASVEDARRVFEAAASATEKLSEKQPG
jgi:hypothetical protein